MARFRKWSGCLTVAAIVILTLAAMFIIVMKSPAKAHDGFEGYNDPVTNAGCCGNSDCGPVPMDVNWVTPTKEGFHVSLTHEQAKSFNPHAYNAIEVDIPWARVMSISSSGKPALYYLCIVGGDLRCLFVASST